MPDAGHPDPAYDYLEKKFAGTRPADNPESDDDNDGAPWIRQLHRKYKQLFRAVEGLEKRVRDLENSPVTSEVSLCDDNGRLKLGKGPCPPPPPFP